MIKFPEVKHKLPELFKEIIRHDNEFRELKNSSVVDLKIHQELKSRKIELLNAADKYVQKQKGAPNA
jgi:hypothetical protein